jgi:hypothetical protein
VAPGLIERITGYADTKPIAGEPPESDSNERVALSLTLNAKARLQDKVMIDKKVPILAEPADAVVPPEP